ncbi:MAG: hypothetical protein FWF43_02705 [Propionibacteriaceae bacterium]|nr:hypothetical protein [Propionibacteriaceae bacterium]
MIVLVIGALLAVWLRLRYIDHLEARGTLHGGAIGPVWVLTWEDGAYRATRIMGRVVHDVRIMISGSDAPAPVEVAKLGPGEWVVLPTSSAPGSDVTITWCWDGETETQTWQGQLPRHL